MVRDFLVLTGETAFALKLHQEPFGELIAVYGWLLWSAISNVHRLKSKADCKTSDCRLEDTTKENSICRVETAMADCHGFAQSRFSPVEAKEMDALFPQTLGCFRFCVLRSLVVRQPAIQNRCHGFARNWFAKEVIHPDCPAPVIILLHCIGSHSDDR